MPRCAGGLRRASARLGLLHLHGFGVTSSYKIALKYFTAAATANDPLGNLMLGSMHYHGWGMAADVKAAIKYFDKAAAAGASPSAHYNLGTIYATGEGVGRSCNKAVDHLKKVLGSHAPWLTEFRGAYSDYKADRVIQALMRYMWLADLGYELAAYNAAYIIESHGEEAAAVFGNASNAAAAALGYYGMSADWDHAESVVKVADMHYHGQGTPADLNASMRLYRKAADAGSAQALFNIGWAHQSGDGLPLDLPMAKRFYDLAHGTKHPDALIPVTMAQAALVAQAGLSFLAGPGNVVAVFGQLAHAWRAVLAWG